MDYIVCNIFPRADIGKAYITEHFINIFTDIKEGKYAESINAIRAQKEKKERDLLKKKIPGFTPSAIFSERRAILNVKEYTGLIVIDIDNISESKADFLKMLLIKDPYVAACFISPSYGLKVFIITNCKNKDEHNLAWETCANYISQYQKYVQFKVDPSGKDVSRLCFISYDPTAFMNLNAQMLDIDYSLLLKEEEFSIVSNRKTEYYNTNGKKLFESALKMIKKSKAGRFVAGNRNNYIFVLSCLCNELGIPNDMALAFISERYSSLGMKEIKTTVNSAYKKTQNFGIKNNSSNQGGLF